MKLLKATILFMTCYFSMQQKLWSQITFSTNVLGPAYNAYHLIYYDDVTVLYHRNAHLSVLFKNKHGIRLSAINRFMRQNYLRLLRNDTLFTTNREENTRTLRMLYQYYDAGSKNTKVRSNYGVYLQGSFRRDISHYYINNHYSKSSLNSIGNTYGIGVHAGVDLCPLNYLYFGAQVGIGYTCWMDEDFKYYTWLIELMIKRFYYTSFAEFHLGFRIL